MRLTSFTDYSLRVLMYLAVQSEGRVTIAEIAAAFRLSKSHLMKIVNFLGKAQLLANVRGNGGGLALGRSAESINIGEVVRLTEMNALPAECFDPKSNTCVITPACKLKGALGEAVKAFYTALGRYTLADVVENHQQLAKILFFPPVRKVAGRAR